MYIQELFKNSDRHSVARKDLCNDPNMQMRQEMDQDTIDQYEENIETILEEHPIKVVSVEANGIESWYVVDGFHRYHGAFQADLDVVDIEIVHGTYEEALHAAMSANWSNGMRPNNKDAARSIGIMLESAPDFGYDSKKVVPWLMTFGIPKTTARDRTKEKRLQIDEMRDAKIEDMLNEGSTCREIAALIGCSVGTVQNVKKSLSVQNERTAQNEHPSEEADDSPFFSDDELDDTPAVNPADAFNKVLKDHEEERQVKEKCTQGLTNVTTCGYNPSIIELTEALRNVDPADVTAPLIAAAKALIEAHA